MLEFVLREVGYDENSDFCWSLSRNGEVVIEKAIYDVCREVALAGLKGNVGVYIEQNKEGKEKYRGDGQPNV